MKQTHYLHCCQMYLQLSQKHISERTPRRAREDDEQRRLRAFSLVVRRLRRASEGDRYKKEIYIYIYIRTAQNSSSSTAAVGERERERKRPRRAKKTSGVCPCVQVLGDLLFILCSFPLLRLSSHTFSLLFFREDFEVCVCVWIRFLFCITRPRVFFLFRRGRCVFRLCTQARIRLGDFSSAKSMCVCCECIAKESF